MTIPNMNYANLKDSYLFFKIAQKTKKFLENNPGKKLLRLGIGDVSLPLCDAVIGALHEAVNDQAVNVALGDVGKRLHSARSCDGVAFHDTFAMALQSRVNIAVTERFCNI